MRENVKGKERERIEDPIEEVMPSPVPLVYVPVLGFRTDLLWHCSVLKLVKCEL